MISCAYGEMIEFLGMIGVGFILALGFRGCDAVLSFLRDFIDRHWKKKP